MITTYFSQILEHVDVMGGAVRKTLDVGGIGAEKARLGRLIIP
jgi:hypothetical protein